MSHEYELFITNIKKLTGIDLSLYKEAQMKRRLTSLYEKKGYASFQQFFIAIHKDSSVLHEFLDRMTINVSEFYRNAERWKVLEQKVFPRLLAKSKKLKIWSAACSTGEEPYTIAMVLSKYIPLNQIEIFATDIDQNVIAFSKLASYPERSLNEVPDEVIRKYFTKAGDRYQLSNEVKRTVTFTKHNLLAEPFGAQYDLIVCRNVLIYFTEEAKHLLYHKFSRALKSGGSLFVGSTEQIFNPGQYGFEAEDTFFYKKKIRRLANVHGRCTYYV